MRIQNVIFMSAILTIALLVGAATASQGNSVSIDGNGNKVDQSNTVVTHNDQATYSSVSSTSTVTNTEYTVLGSTVQQLSKNNIVMNRIIFANQVFVTPINPAGNQTFLIQTGTPVAVYTIESYNDALKTQGINSKLSFNSYFDYKPFDTGDVSPLDAVPYLTSDCHITTSPGAEYLVIDNRYYPADTEAQIGEPHSSEEL